MIRIGILGHDFMEWGGGLDFIRMVCASLHATGEPLELHLLLPVRGPRLLAQRAVRQARRLVARSLGRKGSPSHAPSLSDITEAVAHTGGTVRIHEIDSGTRALQRAFRRLSLDVLLPVFRPLRLGRDTPWIGYIYDFQHHHLPHFFGERERADRDRDFALMLERAPVVIVNARAVERDAMQFRPDAEARLVALPFSAAPSPAWLTLDVDAVRRRYAIQSPYLIVCNQFWVHKDHGTALEAFAQVSAEHPDLLLVCTGATSDYRNPAHFDELMKLAGERGIRPRLRVLGLIPKADQIALVRGATALVQPTLSEGGPGGGAVYDAVALGVPALVSDIDVNREIDEPNVTFFRTGDPQDLANAIRALLKAGTAPRRAPEELLAAGRERRRRCGQTLLDAIALARGR